MTTNEQPEGIEKLGIEEEYEGSHELARAALGEAYKQETIDEIAAAIGFPVLLQELSELPLDEAARPAAIAEWYAKHEKEVESVG
jgi:hypothetical protein